MRKTFATNIASAEAVLHLLSGQLEAPGEHNTAGKFFSEMASVYLNKLTIKEERN